MLEIISFLLIIFSEELKTYNANSANFTQGFLLIVLVEMK